jgi:ABC-type dipeptide/oligopeptide/nickel transport system permease subunit
MNSDALTSMAPTAGRRWTAWAGGVIVAAVLLAALLAPWIAPYPFDEQLRDHGIQRPGALHPFGTDSLSRDLFSRVLYGARVSLQVALAATALSVLIGVAAGAIAGYFGRWADEALMRLADAFSAFPGILLAVAITAAFETRSLLVVFTALGLVGWTNLARIVRGQVLTLREEEFVQAARALGAGRLRILFRHILPNCLAPVIVTASLLMAGNILGEAGLSFLGIGVQPPRPSWGGMLAQARDVMTLYWWTAAFPGAAIALTVLGFNLLGDALRDRLDPKSRAL